MRPLEGNAPGGLNSDGVPGYVFGWCCKAEAQTMQRGYRDVGYLLLQRARNFRPPQITEHVWQERLVDLLDLCRANHAAHVWEWCLWNFPTLAQRVPRERRDDFVAGMVERVWGHEQ